MKKLLLFLCAIGLAFGVAGNAQATLLNLTGVKVGDVDPEASGIINGALFERLDKSKAGRGVFPTFLELQQDPSSGGITQGYNTDYRGEGYPDYQQGNALPHNYIIELDWLGQIQLDSTWYYSFALDVDQAPGVDPWIRLDELEIYQTNDREAFGYPNGLGTKVWELDPGAEDNTVLLDYLLSGSGSGKSDMIVSIPVSLFINPDLDYVVLYSLFSNDNDGPQEWSYMAGEGAPVPEPATMLLLGSGLIGLGVFGRKRLFKKS